MENGRQVTAVVVAAGRSRRMGFDKLFYPLNGVEVLRHAVNRLDAHPAIDSLVVVTGESINRVRALFEAHPLKKPLAVVEGGDTRAASVAAGVAACPNAWLVAIHDGARPFVSDEVISRVVGAAAEMGAAAPAVPERDTLKRVKDGLVEETVPREQVMRVQTPQVFNRALFLQALAALAPGQAAEMTDDCMVMERAGYPVRLVEGEEANRKITTPEDLPAGPAMPRVGHGYDVHRLVPGRRLVLGGVEIEYERGLLGHSDADVLAHAVTDALLGAAAMGDIGQLFPPSDSAYKDADSMRLLAGAAAVIRRAGFAPHNIDATVLCEQPKLARHIPAMRRCLAAVLGLAEQAVSVKATTEEGLGFTGAGQGIAAHCVAMVGPAGEGAWADGA